MPKNQLADNQCIYHDFHLQIVGETGTNFIIGNMGESVGVSDSINTQFMLIKDVLGFEQTGFGCFEKSISKFEDQLQLAATKLIAHKTWLYRVLGEDSNNYLLQIARNAENSVDWAANGWKLHGMSYLKWMGKNEVTEIQPFITYWGARPR
jgi:hypothetical protein